MQIQKIIGTLRGAKARFVVLLCHHNADPDAICSAYAFSQLLKKMMPTLDIEIAAAQGTSRLSKHILKKIPARLVVSPRIEDADVIVMLDTNTIQQLDDWKPRVEDSGKPLIVIDHHAVHPETERLSALCVMDENASSTCEMVYDLFREAKVKPTEDEATALFLGLACDTRHFTLASSKTFKIVTELIEAGVNVEKALSLLSMPMDTSERIARLKAARRVRLVRMGEWLMAFSRVRSYQASAARALLSLGAHVAVVGGEKEGILRVSLRASGDFREKTGIHLGRDIARPLGEYVHGMGGGHVTSAGVNGEGDLEFAFKKCIRLFREKLSNCHLSFQAPPDSRSLP